MPANWVAKGDPALGDAVTLRQRVELFVRAQNTATSEIRILRARFNPTNQTWDANWVFIPTNNVTITTDPAVEYDPEDRITLYLKGNSRIYQSSENNGVWQQWTTINNNTFVGSPAAVGNVPLPGSHAVVAKKIRQSTAVRIHAARSLILAAPAERVRALRGPVSSQLPNAPHSNALGPNTCRWCIRPSGRTHNVSKNGDVLST